MNSNKKFPILITKLNHFASGCNSTCQLEISFYFNISGERVHSKMLPPQLIVSCCALFEFLFLNQCIHYHDNLTSIDLNKPQFQCDINAKVIENEVIIRSFSGVFAFKNAEERAHCFQELSGSPNNSSNINILEVCKMELRSLKIKSYGGTDLTNFSNIERYAGNITELTWELHDASIEVLPKADILKIYQGFYIDPTFLSDMKKLQKLVINCERIAHIVYLPLFQGLTNLSELNLNHCFYNSSAEHFQDLTNLRVLNISDAVFRNADFLRYVVLVCLLIVFG